MRRFMFVTPVILIIGCFNPTPRYYLADGEWDLAVRCEADFGFPSGIAVGPKGVMYVTDTIGNRVVCFSRDGSFLRAWGKEGTGDGEFRSPKGLAVSPDGYVYVADNYNERIQPGQSPLPSPLDREMASSTALLVSP